jgi:hypothetical protein
MLSLKKRYPFNRPKESQIKIDSETILSPPSTVQRETYIIRTNPVSPVDITKDIIVGHKRHAQDQQNSTRRQRDIQVPQGTP